MAVGGVFPSLVRSVTREAVAERDGIAERCPLPRPERPESATHEHPVLRGRNGDIRTSAESDHADTELLRHPVDESLRGSLRGDQPGRPDVLRAHRQRRVDRDEHGCLLALNPHARMRARDTDDHRGQRDDEQRKRQMSAPAGRRVDEVRQQARRGEPSGISLPAPFTNDVQPHEHGYDDERDQRQRRLEAHRR